MTKNKLSEIGKEDFRRTNEGLTNRLLRFAELPSVTKVLYVSSGASVYPNDALNSDFDANPYGFLKRNAELSLSNLVESSSGQKSVSILRAWSVSGKYVRNPDDYLFSSLIMQALSGEIVVRSPSLVLRRYVSVGDAITLAISNFAASRLSILDTGGELIESRDLAELVRSLVNPLAKIRAANPTPYMFDNYYSDNSSWLDAVDRFKYAPASIPEQIDDCARFFTSQ